MLNFQHFASTNLKIRDFAGKMLNVQNPLVKSKTIVFFKLLDKIVVAFAYGRWSPKRVPTRVT